MSISSSYDKPFYLHHSQTRQVIHIASADQLKQINKAKTILTTHVNLGDCQYRILYQETGSGSSGAIGLYWTGRKRSGGRSSCFETKTETTNTTVKKEKVEAISAVPQELAYYEGLIEEYFKNDDPTILEELGATVSQSRLTVAY